MAFIRLSTTKWVLDNDTRDLLGSILVYLRQECETAATVIDTPTELRYEGVIEGIAVNYKKQVEAIDRLLSRVSGSFDAQKLATAFAVFARAQLNAGGQHIGKKDILEAVEHHGTLAPYIRRGGGENEGSNQLASETGAGTDGTVNGNGGSNPFAENHVNDRSRGYPSY